MPTVVFTVLFFYSPVSLSMPGAEMKAAFLTSVFVFTFLVPLVSVFTFGLASLKGYNLHERRHRIVPFTFVSIFYSIVSYFFILKLDLDPSLSVIFIAVTVSIIISTAITWFWKISLHSVGICGTAGFLLGFAYKYPESRLLFPLVIAVLCCGLVMSARLSLNSHRVEEVFGGCLLGFLVCFLSVMFFA